MLNDYLSQHFDAKAMEAGWAEFVAICLCVARITCSAIGGAAEKMIMPST
jgi:hypothetical protein